MNPEARKYLAAIGRRGGKATSVAKALAARENAKRGGWPKGKRRKLKKRANEPIKPPLEQDASSSASAPANCSADGRKRNYWTEQEAGNDVEMPRCIHGQPRNVFCDVCDG